VTASAARIEGAFLSGLRVRIKELAQEARFIRFEEHKIQRRATITSDIVLELDTETKKLRWVWNNPESEEFWKLRNHRLNDVRDAARAAQLTYGFLRGKLYKQLEPSTHDPEWRKAAIRKEVKRIAKKFGGRNFNEELDIWFNA
jgi:hypothetical protein